MPSDKHPLSVILKSCQDCSYSYVYNILMLNILHNSHVWIAQEIYDFLIHRALLVYADLRISHRTLQSSLFICSLSNCAAVHGTAVLHKQILETIVLHIYVCNNFDVLDYIVLSFCVFSISTPCANILSIASRSCDFVFFYVYFFLEKNISTLFSVFECFVLHFVSFPPPSSKISMLVVFSPQLLCNVLPRLYFWTLNIVHSSALCQIFYLI